MPKSRSKRSTYKPPPKKKPKASPRWFGALIIGVMLLGVAVIVVNYLKLMPFTGTPATGFETENWPLFTGLGLIAFGFLLSTQWR